MEEDLRQELKRLTGERNRVVWEIAKTGDLSGLSAEDKKLAEIMLEHEEFHNLPAPKIPKFRDKGLLMGDPFALFPG